jgi:hypothetical protein
MHFYTILYAFMLRTGPTRHFRTFNKIYRRVSILAEVVYQWQPIVTCPWIFVLVLRHFLLQAILVLIRCKINCIEKKNMSYTLRSAKFAHKFDSSEIITEKKIAESIRPVALFVDLVRITQSDLGWYRGQVFLERDIMWFRISTKVSEKPVASAIISSHNGRNCFVWNVDAYIPDHTAFHLSERLPQITSLLHFSRRQVPSLLIFDRRCSWNNYRVSGQVDDSGTC